jgi:hypothetical protein
MLAIAFVLRYRVTFLQQGAKLGAVPGFPATTRLRARMFLANIFLEEERTHREFARTPGLKKWAKALATAPARAAEATQGIGEVWARRLKSTRSYSGLSVKDLSLSLGLGQAYATHYRMASWSIHPVQIGRHLTIDADGQNRVNLSPGLDDVAVALDTANSFLVACLRFVDDRLGLSLGASLADHERTLFE